MDTMTLKDGYDRTKNPPTAEYRVMTPAEASLLRPGSRAYFRTVDGIARMLTVNGQPKTWKRDASRVEVPCKYGMYEYSTFYATVDGTGMWRMVSDDGAVLLVKVQGGANG
jgi:hypothetical protein